MEKNRKNKNVVSDKQAYYVLESEDHIQKAPEAFLTSDDFCVVQKKRNLKKSSDDQDYAYAFCHNLNSSKQFSTKEESNCHTGFWNCKSSENVTDSTVVQNPTNSASEISEENFKNSMIAPNESSSDVNLKPSLNILSSGISATSKISECIVNNVLKNDLSSIKSECYTKKKSKKKEHKIKSDEYEVEKILKELGFVKDEFGTPESSNVSCSLWNKKFDKLKCRVMNKSNESFKVPDKTVINFPSSDSGNIEKKSHSDINYNCNNTSIAHDGNVQKSSLIPEEEKKYVHKTAAQKRKEKRLKAKLRNGIGHLEKLSQSCIVESNNKTVYEKDFKENLVNCDKEKIVEASENKNRKRPSKKQLAIIQEVVRKSKDEEERLKRAEEVKRKIAEEAEKIRQEIVKLEQEKKEKKKLKEKQKREKMKSEGRLLSKSQKQSRARMEVTLAALRQQGINVPQICDKRAHSHDGPQLGNNKNFHRRRFDSSRSNQSVDSAVVISERQKSESLSSQESSGKQSVCDLPSSFDSTNDSALPESDRGNFSCSEESLDKIDIHATDPGNKKTILSKAKPVFQNVQNKFESFSKMKFKESSGANLVKLRSPVVCVLGHVDTGKTKILDYIRKTHIQDSEAGGITQQIGATMIPCDALKEKCKMVKGFSSLEMKIPGLLVIDTPGHESFSNLRFRGSSICDIAVLVVDIMHGLEPQTIESINLLKKGKTPFVVALNKVDRIYGWKSDKDGDIQNTIMNQSHAAQTEFKRRCQEIVLQFANQCLNACLFYDNKDPRSYLSMVPTSAISGDGMGNILSIIAELTQSIMQKKLVYKNKLEATVLEVKAISGLGTTIDVILVNGELHEGDTIILAGQDGPIITQIRSLLMPQPLKELRVKNPYIEYKTIKGAQGVKITGKDLDKSLAGLPLFVAQNHSMIDALKEEMNRLFGETMNSIKTSERGVYVQASTLGSLEALLEFLTTSGIPYFSVKIGPVVKKDVMKASIMLEHDIQYAAILAFDVKIERDAQELAGSLGVNIFHADIIYHLFDMYIEFRNNLLLKRDEDVKRLAVFPCKLRVIPEFIFLSREPIMLGVDVEDGILKEGTPLCVPSRNYLDIGVVSSIEYNGDRVLCAKKGDKVIIKIDSKSSDSLKAYCKNFNHEDLLISHITRQSIDICKQYFRNELQPNDWHLMVELKKILHIV